MFCTKCGTHLHDSDKFCGQCGELCGENGGNTAEQLLKPKDSDPSTGKIFMEQLDALSKTGVKGIKEAAAKAQIKAGELSQSVEQSQNLNQLGEKRNLLLFVVGALALNLILLLSKTLYIDLLSIRAGTFSVIGFCTAMLDVMDTLGRFADGATDAPFYTAIKYLEIIGIIFIIAAVVKTLLPLFTNDDSKTISFKLIKIAAIFSVVLTFLFMFICTIGLSSQRGVEFHLTFLGWLYVIESIILIIAVFKLSPKVKKNNAPLS